MTLLFRSRNRRWKARHTVSLLAVAACTAALISVRAGWLPPILYSGRHFGGDLSLASNRDHIFLLSSTSAQDTPRVVSFPRSLAYWRLVEFVDLTNELIDARDGRQVVVGRLAPDDPRLPVARFDAQVANSQIRRVVEHLCGMTSYIPSNPMRAGFAFGKFQTATHVAYVSWYWIWAILSAAPASVLSLAAIRRLKSRPGPGHCLACNYDLTGNESGKCPECGQPTAATGENSELDNTKHQSNIES